MRRIGCLFGVCFNGGGLGVFSGYSLSFAFACFVGLIESILVVVGGLVIAFRFGFGYLCVWVWIWLCCCGLF